MKFVFVSYNYSPDFDSPEAWFKRTEGYSGILEALGKNNTVINVKQINFKGDVINNGVQYRFVDFDRGRNYFPHRLNLYIKNLQPDIAVVQGLHHPLQLIQLRVLLGNRTQIIVQHHAERPFTGLKKSIQKTASYFADAYLFASKPMGDGWVKNGNLASFKKIHEVMEVSSVFSLMDKVRAKTRTCVSGSPVFLFVGTLTTRKDPLTVVKAFLRFAEERPLARLYMVYQIDELLTELRQLLNESPQRDAVLLVGKLVHSELEYWYNSADFIIAGSHYEGSGTAVCEAISCGCIPILTNIPPFRMITDNGDCGVLYETGNEDALLSALVQTGSLDVEKMKLRSLAYFKARLSFEAIAGRIEEIGASLI